MFMSHGDGISERCARNVGVPVEIMTAPISACGLHEIVHWLVQSTAPEAPEVPEGHFEVAVSLKMHAMNFLNASQHRWVSGLCSSSGTLNNWKTQGLGNWI
jgi:hypothetical protein